ncbi:Gamma-D-glutamyl-L-lysine endopeptidase [Paenibacillus konkukensis]|uniref:Gamma-D-glutamyl-L-lysine endopeptidase n=1 Tax=Paenibacillus konkukensis TaxID=2020716 RepID=A0ABY4RV93_9BACL|nr:NlpC/P60 family protein [Paenibacillus konkukensis]UQZ85669.1 Gamma-D-glutamyl-L-lysine endopeptidase [Paenibacillus konkukensis]
MSQGERKIVAVSVACVWTKPDSSRLVDEPALQRPAGIRAWLDAMTLEERLDLCNGNRLQTQVLYGTEVIVAEVQGEWARIFIPSQSTRKEAAGYPGWVRSAQLADPAADSGLLPRADVVSAAAWLHTAPAAEARSLELSFMTSLPVLAEEASWVKVRTPDGIGYLQTGDVRITESSPASVTASSNGHVGASILEQGRRFLGLPYLWGGLSSFGYDCSGFVYSMHRYAGITIPRDASDQARHGLLVEKERLEPGDLLFFAYEEGRGAVHHVGMYAGHGRMIHSPETGKTIEIVELSGYKLALEHCVSRRYWS